MLIKYHLGYYGISCLLLVICLLVHPVFWLFYLGYLLFIIYRLGLINLICIIVFTVIFALLLQWPKPLDETVIKGRIVTIDEKSMVIKTKQTKVKVYGEVTAYRLDDEIEVAVEYFEINEPTNDNAFNYRNYLYSQGITNNALLKQVVNVTRHKTMLQRLQERISGDDLVSSYTSMFILGIKDETIQDYYQQLTDLSIVHLFALSGLHIHMLKQLLKKPLRFILPEKYIDYVIVIVIGIYIYVIPFNVSFIRAYLITLLSVLFKKYLNKLDCLALVTILMLIINPYVIYSLSFIFSYFMYFVILMLNDYKYFNAMIYLASIPIILAVQYRINLLSLFLGIVLVPLITLLYQMIWFYLILGNFFKPIISLIIYFLNNIIVFSHDFSVFLNFSKPSLFFILAYYFIYFKIVLKINVKRKITREVLLLLSLVLMFYLKPLYTPVGKVVMIDVGQGDCFLIQQPFNQGNILIDTGGLKNKDIATLTLVPYLKSQGIYQLDYVFVSHDDFDHCGAYDSLAKQVAVKHKITSYQDKMKIGNVEIEMLAGKGEDNENDQSLVIKATINHLVYLFTGDASSTLEQSLVQNYPDLKVDVLKVSHHGSSGATSALFLDVIKPKIALISCGKNNLYGHPNKEVLARLEAYDVKIYRSDLMGMVKIIYFGNDNYIYQ